MACRLAVSSSLFMGPQQSSHRINGLQLPRSSVYSFNWERILRRGTSSLHCLVNMKRTRTVQAVATPVVPSPTESVSSEDSADYRKQLAESYGFTQIGEPLPENVTLKDVIDTLPKKFFVIGHDCAHRSFSKNKLVEDIIGTLSFFPLIYPYEPWRFKHDRHHAKTNMLIEDTAWLPIVKEEFDSSSLLRKAIIYGYGPFRTWMSIAHWNNMINAVVIVAF